MDNKKCAQISGWGKARKILSNGGISGGQSKLDVDGDGKITGKDFAMLRNKKKKTKKQKPSMMAMAMKGKK